MENDRTNIDLVKEKTDIVAVIARYVNLKQAGKNWRGLCPFHTEKTPSFNVSEDIQIYKCFGCGKSGDVFNFIEEIEKLDFNETLEKLAKEAGVELKKSNQQISPVIQINEWAKIYFQKELYEKRNQIVLDYVRNRGITDDLIKEFEIGYSPGDNNFYRRLIKYRKYSKDILLDSGLFTEKNGSLTEKFIKRVVFPIHNLSGKIVAYTGRRLPNNDYGPKYLNSPETSIYQKRNSLYGLYQAKSSIKRDDLCIILEGQTGVIALHKIGYKNAVAPLGTGLTTQQLELIKRYTNNILFIFDNDSAGQNALERGFRMALELNLNCYAISPGKYKDIDELIQDNPNEFKELYDKRKDAYTYLLASKLETLNLKDLKSITYIKQYINSFLEVVSDETIKNFYKEKALSMVPTLDLEILKSNTYVKPVISKQLKRLDIEEMFFKSIFEQERFNIGEEINEEYITIKSNKELFNIVVQNKISNVSELYKFVEDDRFLKEHLENIMLSKGEIQDKEVLIKRIKKRYYETSLNNLRILLASAEEKEDTSRIKELLEQVLELSNKLKTLKNEDI